MKFRFNYFLVMTMLINSSSLFSRDVILIENLAGHEEGQTLLRIIQEKFNIPRKLITYKKISRECSKSSDAIMQLCLKENGEMDILKINKLVIEETFRVFAEAGE